jgi:hypothetical protein
MFRAENRQARRRAPTPGPGKAARLAAIAAVAVAWAVAAAPAAAQTTLGTAASGTASCPANCLVEARVTGFQSTVGGVKAPLTTPAPGRIVSWSINLGSPDDAALQYFKRRFGAASARLSVLKPVRSKGGRKRGYRLLRQSPAQGLKPYFGSLATFKLRRPLKVGEGQKLALTIPTWAPAFSVGHTDATTWRASRASTERRGDCFTSEGLANLNAGSPQQRLGSQRAYGCSYRGAMLLYSATFVPN